MFTNDSEVVLSALKYVELPCVSIAEPHSLVSA